MCLDMGCVFMATVTEGDTNVRGGHLGLHNTFLGRRAGAQEWNSTLAGKEPLVTAGLCKSWLTAGAFPPGPTLGTAPWHLHSV